MEWCGTNFGTTRLANEPDVRMVQAKEERCHRDSDLVPMPAEPSSQDVLRSARVAEARGAVFKRSVAQVKRRVLIRRERRLPWSTTVGTTSSRWPGRFAKEVNGGQRRGHDRELYTTQEIGQVCR